MRSAFIGIIGRPNVGKSTLLNALLGEKVAIASSKPQTTRNTIRGIYNEPDLQLVFLDTPGIHKPRNKLGGYMNEMVNATLQEVDAILFLTDSAPDKGPGDRYILERLKEIDTPKFMIINKIDLLDPDTYRRTYDYYDGTGLFEGVLGTCAATGKGVDEVLAKVSALAPEGPQYFPDDMTTDQPERFLAAEIIREKLLQYLEDEIPHGVAVTIESYEEDQVTKDGSPLQRIGAVIYCERKSHKGIIIGKNGRKLKGIGKSARQELEALLGSRVYLDLWVKIKEKWRDDEIALRNFGYRESS